MKKVVLIDDNVEFNATLKEFLELEDFEVISAFDGTQGLSLIYQEKPDLIITDIIMPEMEGIELLDQLTKYRLQCPTKIIAISGGGRIGAQQYLEFAKEIGADYVFDKPLKFKEFINAIRELLD
ncbi:MAG: response regulator [Pseudomonadales bacterium]